MRCGRGADNGIRTRHRKARPRVPDRVTALKSWRDHKAADLDLDPGLVLNKNLIQALAVAKPDRQKDLAAIEDIRRWRCRAFGRELVALMKSLQ